MTAKVILNPYAGRWKGLEHKEEVIRALHAVGIKHELVVTSSPGDAKMISAQSVDDGYNPIIAAGGDGSISEVVNGIMLAKVRGKVENLPSLGIIPLGSANDLAVNLKLPTEINGAAEVIAKGESHMLDLGCVNTRYFDNNSAIGLEPTITLIQQKITLIKGPVRYLLAALIGVMKNKSWRVKLSWHDGEFIGPVSLVTVGNNRKTGGIFYVTPHANPFDGLLTFVFGYLPTRVQVLRALQKTLKADDGNYVELPSVHEFHTTWLNIRSEDPTPLHADGEIQSDAITDVQYKIIPKVLPIIMSYS